MYRWENKLLELYYDDVNFIYYLDVVFGGVFDYFKLNGVKYSYVYELCFFSGFGIDGFIFLVL